MAIRPVVTFVTIVIRTEAKSVFRFIPALDSRVGGDLQRDDVFGLLGRLDGKPFLRLAFADELAVVLEDHARRVARLKADLAHVFGGGGFGSGCTLQYSRKFLAVMAAGEKLPRQMIGPKLNSRSKSQWSFSI